MINMNQNKEGAGLSGGNISYIVGIICAAIIIFGPVSDNFIFRSATIILLPAIVWLGLRHYGKKWDMDRVSNDRLSRAISALLGGVFIVLAVLSLNQKYHQECTKEVKTRDGSECVGDFVRVRGSDKSGAFIDLIFAGLALWHAIAKRPETDL